MLHFLITAGPTHEPVDAVRYLGNRSSGRLGIALAEAAAAGGHRVTLLLGPSCAEPTAGAAVRTERFESTADLEASLAEHFPSCDVLIMAAAVADYRPAGRHDGKLERRGEGLRLDLEPTPDLVAQAVSRRRGGQRVVAFALEEPGRVEARGGEKLRRKGVDAIIANPLATMQAATVEGRYLTAGGEDESFGPMPKRDFAAWLLPRVESLVRAGDAD